MKSQTFIKQVYLNDYILNEKGSGSKYLAKDMQMSKDIKYSNQGIQEPISSTYTCEDNNQAI